MNTGITGCKLKSNKQNKRHQPLILTLIQKPKKTELKNKTQKTN